MVSEGFFPEPRRGAARGHETGEPSGLLVGRTPAWLKALGQSLVSLTSELILSAGFLPPWVSQSVANATWTTMQRRHHLGTQK